MIRTISLISAITILLFFIVIAFENLFFADATYYILFWEFSGSVTWLIVGTFFFGIIFGSCLFLFFTSNPLSIDSAGDMGGKDKEWE